MYLHKDDLKKIFRHFTFRSQAPNNNSNAVISNDVPMEEFDHIIDDDARNNATVTICAM